MLASRLDLLLVLVALRLDLEVAEDDQLKLSALERVLMKLLLLKKLMRPVP